MNERYRDSYGMWKVTDSATLKDFGVYVGHLDEIAFALADKCSSALSFEKVGNLGVLPAKERVDIRLDVESETWGNMDERERVADIRNMLSGRPVIVRDGKYLFSVELRKARAILDEIRERALAKLSKEERIVLGIE